MDSFKLQIMASDHMVFDGEAKSVSMFTTEGSVGILAHHSNLIMAVVPGELEYEAADAGGKKEMVIVSDGLLKVENGEVMVLVDTAEKPEEIDEARALRAEEAAKEALEKKEEEYKDLLAAIKASLGDKVSEVKLTDRLAEHPVCLTTKGGLSLEMERVLNAAPAGEAIKAERVLEINADHEILDVLKAAQAEDKEKMDTYAQLLYDQALLIEGMPIDDPVRFSTEVCKLMK